MTEICNFVESIGKDIINFQGTGGNISYKDNGFLYIKASGYKIEDIYKRKKLSKIDINNFFDDLNIINDLTEDKLNFIVEKNNVSDLKSSIETGFHLLFNSKYVIHTHNTYINVLLCMEGGEKIIYNLFGKNISIIDYYSPGFGLFNKLKKSVNLTDVIFLKNHGIILHGDKSFFDLYEKLNSIENIIRKHLELDIFKENSEIGVIDKHIFPDSIIINNLDIYSSDFYIKSQIKKLGGEVHYLPIEEVNKIKNMEKEKYRKELFNKNYKGE